MQVKQNIDINYLEPKKEEKRIRFVIIELNHVIVGVIIVVVQSNGVLVVRCGPKHVVLIMGHVCVVNF